MSLSPDQMTLEEKVGQLLLVHFHGRNANDAAEKLISVAHVGGFVYYEWSNELGSYTQVLSLSKELQMLSRKYSKLPLFLAIDQEGGPVARLKKDFTHFPSSRDIGLINIPSLAYDVALAQGLELKLAGLNMNLAPVADIACHSSQSVVGERSFGATPTKVTEFVQESLKGYKASSIIAVIKHFPGHGDINVDPHLSTPTLTKTLDELMSHELQPFYSLKDQTEALMTSHFIVAGVDPEKTVSSSSFFIKNLLRSIWKYNGIVMTDSLAMKGILSQEASLESAAVSALIAGNDMICLGGKLLSEKSQNEISLDDVLKIHSYIVKMVNEGVIDEKEIDEKVRRIIHLKQKYCYDLDDRSHIASTVFSESKLLKSEINTLLRFCTIDASLAKSIARKVWHNETGSSKEKLLYWNPNEDFLSLGVGHFIWYPKEKKTSFEEIFPSFVKYMIKEGVDVPQWIQNASYCPWENKTSFQTDHPEKVKELRLFIEGSMDMQGKFLLAQVPKTLHSIIEQLTTKIEKEKVLSALDSITAQPNGIYAIIDYLNFKGSGLSSSERYNGIGWGLLQVFEKLCSYPGQVTVKDFCIEAKKQLENRVANAPDPKKEGKWLKGWQSRIDTYENIF